VIVLIKQLLVRRWFLIALIVILVVGFAFAEGLESAADQVPRTPIVALVLLLMSLPMDVRVMWRALRYPMPALLAVAINFGLVPPLAWVAAKLLPEQLGTGLIVIAVIPCTIASAAVWTRRAGGNDAVAILVTMITNLACFLVTPAWLQALTGDQVQLDFGEMVLRLCLLVVVPILLAQLMRISYPVARWATAKKTLLGVLSQCGILSMVLVGTIQSGNQLAHNADSSAILVSQWGLMLAAVVGVHLVALGFGHLASALLGLDRGDRIAVGFAGSQKTLVVGLDIGLGYFGGLTILPMVAYHIGQLVLDTLIADRFLKNSQQAALDPPEIQRG
jgi:sodium/bile acid cotransporter 7